MFRPGSFFRPLDAFLIVLITAAACWGFLGFHISEGDKAIVYISNKKYAWYELAGEKRKVEVPTRIGPVWLEIGEGGARVISSPCPNKICVRTGTVRHTHEEIACIPAHLLLVIEGKPGGEAKGQVDAITF